VHLEIAEDDEFVFPIIVEVEGAEPTVLTSGLMVPAVADVDKQLMFTTGTSPRFQTGRAPPSMLGVPASVL
jgi:hypothetical protein